jgi:hypothetical protein
MVGRNKSFKQIRFPASLVSNIYERWTRIVDAEGPMLGLNEVILNDEERLTFDTFASWLNSTFVVPGGGRLPPDPPCWTQYRCRP